MIIIKYLIITTKINNFYSLLTIFTFLQEFYHYLSSLMIQFEQLYIINDYNRYTYVDRLLIFLDASQYKCNIINM